MWVHNCSTVGIRFRSIRILYLTIKRQSFSLKTLVFTHKILIFISVTTFVRLSFQQIINCLRVEIDVTHLRLPEHHGKRQVLTTNGLETWVNELWTQGNRTWARKSPRSRRMKVISLFLYRGKDQFLKVSPKFQVFKYVLKCLFLINWFRPDTDSFSMYFLKSVRYFWAQLSRQILIFPFAMQLPDSWLSNCINNSLI